jgi:hypothetical protein
VRERGFPPKKREEVIEGAVHEGEPVGMERETAGGPRSIIRERKERTDKWAPIRGKGICTCGKVCREREFGF